MAQLLKLKINQKLFHKKNVEKKERLHGDGINFDNNSPEALDEIFFNNKITDYTVGHRLYKTEYFRIFIKGIC